MSNLPFSKIFIMPLLVVIISLCLAALVHGGAGGLIQAGLGVMAMVAYHFLSEMRWKDCFNVPENVDYEEDKEDND